jgi:hypothetical protein
MGGVIGEGKVGGRELNVRNNDGRILQAHGVKRIRQEYCGRQTLRVGAAMRRVCRRYPSRLLILEHQQSMNISIIAWWREKAGDSLPSDRSTTH